MVAHYEDRSYTFKILERKEEQITVDLYDTRYIFVKSKEVWENHNSNRFNMNVDLIKSIIETIER